MHIFFSLSICILMINIFNAYEVYCFTYKVSALFPFLLLPHPEFLYSLFANAKYYKKHASDKRD